MMDHVTRTMPIEERVRPSKWDDPSQRGLPRSSLEAAAEAAAKVNAMLIAKGKLKPSQLSTNTGPKAKAPQSQSNLIVAEVEINDVPISCRNLLTRGCTQDDISKMSGAAVSTRGRFMPPEEKGKGLPGDRPLYLCVQGSNQECVDKAVNRIREIIATSFKGTGGKGPRFGSPPPGVRPRGPPVSPRFTPPPVAQPPPLMSLNTQPTGTITVVQDKLFVGLEHAPPTFDVKGKLLGPGGSYLQHIQSETGAKITLRGRGSGVLEAGTGREALEPLHAHIQHPSLAIVQQAKVLAENLVETVRQEFAQFQQMLAALPPSVPPPGTTFLTGLPQQPQQSAIVPSSSLAGVIAQPPPPVATSVGGQVQGIPIGHQSGPVSLAPPALGQPGIGVLQPAVGATLIQPQPGSQMTALQPVASSMPQPVVPPPMGNPSQSVALPTTATTMITAGGQQVQVVTQPLQVLAPPPGQPQPQPQPQQPPAGSLPPSIIAQAQAAGLPPPGQPLSHQQAQILQQLQPQAQQPPMQPPPQQQILVGQPPPVLPQAPASEIQVVPITQQVVESVIPVQQVVPQQQPPGPVMVQSVINPVPESVPQPMVGQVVGPPPGQIHPQAQHQGGPAPGIPAQPVSLSNSMAPAQSSQASSQQYYSQYVHTPTSSVASSVAGVTYRDTRESGPLKRRFTEEKQEEKLPENLLGYQHGPPHLAKLVTSNPPPPPPTSSQQNMTSQAYSATAPPPPPPPPTEENRGGQPSRGDLREDRGLMAPPPPPPPMSALQRKAGELDKQLMPPPPPPPPGGGDRGAPDRKKMKGALGTVAGYGSDEEDEDVKSSLRRQQQDATKYSYNQYASKPQIYNQHDPSGPHYSAPGQGEPVAVPSSSYQVPAAHQSGPGDAQASFSEPNSPYGQSYGPAPPQSFHVDQGFVSSQPQERLIASSQYNSMPSSSQSTQSQSPSTVTHFSQPPPPPPPQPPPPGPPQQYGAQPSPYGQPSLQYQPNGQGFAQYGQPMPPPPPPPPHFQAPPGAPYWIPPT